MVERARRSVGATIAAARAALTDGVAATLAGGTHHASADKGSGFCVFNDTAVAARLMQAEWHRRRAPTHGALLRIAVIDLDVHQGNGTASIFRDDETVFTLSQHGASNFPFRKESSDLDVGLPDGCRDDEYLDALDSALDALWRRHGAVPPGLIFYLAGPTRTRTIGSAGSSSVPPDSPSATAASSNRRARVAFRSRCRWRAAMAVRSRRRSRSSRRRSKPRGRAGVNGTMRVHEPTRRFRRPDPPHHPDRRRDTGDRERHRVAPLDPRVPPGPVPRAVIEEILAVAARAPSGTNTQPWKVYVLTGEAKRELSRRVIAAYDDPVERATHTEEYDYYPTEWRSPFVDRRRRRSAGTCTGLLGIAKTDKGPHACAAFAQLRILRGAGWADVHDRPGDADRELARLRHVPAERHDRRARARPAHLPAGRLHAVPPDHRAVIGAPPNEQLVCGMSLGHADFDAVENALVTERAPIAGVAPFFD
jgi:nitroreductase